MDMDIQYTVVHVHVHMSTTIIQKKENILYIITRFYYISKTYILCIQFPPHISNNFWAQGWRR
jgi:hypothetical protein